MTTFREIKFKELLLEPIKNGVTRPSKVRGSGYRMVNMGELFSYGRLSDQPMELVPMTAQELHNYSLQSGDLLFARQSLVLEGVGKCSMVMSVTEPTTFESHLIRGRIDQNIADPCFYYYYFNSPHGKAKTQSIAIQVSAAGIRGSDLINLAIICPPLPTQKKIASILSAYDDLIENNTRRIKILEEMAQAIYREWFVHFRFPGYENVPMVDSELGEIPQGWEVKRLGDVCTAIFSGGTPSTQKDEFWNGNRPWLSSGETRNRLITETEKHITLEGVQGSSTRLALSGDVVVASAGQGNTRGQASLCMIDTYINQSLIALRANNQFLVSGYLFAILSTSYETLRAISDSSSSRGSLTQAMFRDFPFLSPPIEYQVNFQSQSDSLLMLMGGLIAKNQNLRKTRDLLLPRLISGRLDVEELDIAV